MRRFVRFLRNPLPVAFAGSIACFLAPSTAGAQCPEATALNYQGSGTVVCPCFIMNEQAGAQLSVPADQLPIEVLRVGIAWGSQFGGSPQSLEQAVNVYAGGLPNPGTPVSSLPGPLLTDGFINEFDLEAFNLSAVISANPFVVSLQFLNDNSGDPFAGSVVHDGNGCTPARNVVFAIPGGWFDACVLGVSGDWVMYAVYRQAGCGTPAPEHVVASVPVALFPPQPNPFRAGTRIDFFVERERAVNVSVYDVLGRRVAGLAERTVAPGPHSLEWDGRRADGTPGTAGVYFVVLDSEGFRQTRKVTLAR